MVEFNNRCYRVTSIAVEESIVMNDSMEDNPPMVILQLEGGPFITRHEVFESELETHLTLLNHGNPTGGDGTDVFAHL
jgi:hypothetical protein